MNNFNRMKLGLVVNKVKNFEKKNSAVRIAMTATNRGHEVYFMSVDDFSYGDDDLVYAKVCSVPGSNYKNVNDYMKDLESIPREDYQKLDVTKLDILMLRNNPSCVTENRSWARGIAIDFAKLASIHGVIVLNSPEGLSKANNKMYFQQFPEEVRPRTIITQDRKEIKHFCKECSKIVIKPLTGSGGKNVFLMKNEDVPNMNQMIDAVKRDGYIVVQEYLPLAEKGDVRMFLMNGRPLVHEGRYAVYKRMNSEGDLRNNLSAGGKPAKAEVTEDMLRIAEIVGPKLIEDGMFLVGLDIVGDKLLEINVFCPGGLGSLEITEGINFAEPIIDALERKVDHKERYFGNYTNNQIATL